MTLSIERIAITLQGGPDSLGSDIAQALPGALRRRLSESKLLVVGDGLAMGTAALDLGVIDAPAGADARALTQLIAARVIDWVTREHGGSDTDASAATAGEPPGAR